jgi:ribulose-phosphate 3-epimerase
MQVIPAILAKTKSEFVQKVRSVAPYVSYIQLDIMDGKFVPNITWGSAGQVKKVFEEIGFRKNFEVHLMVKNPEKVIAKWAHAGAKRIIYHFEATENHAQIIKKIKSLKCEAGIAINPETPAKKLLPYIYSINFVLVMSVIPGFSGQEFHPEVLKKIKEIKKINKKVKVGVDGGVNLQTAKKIVAAGADVLNAANAIFKSGNIKETIKRLKSL